MKAILIEEFSKTPKVANVADPKPNPDGVVIKVEATGICRSDWHAWKGHDEGITLPHVPGHELSGTIIELGGNVRNLSIGDRVTVPFVGGCGSCPQCHTGNQQVCDNQFQPGFTHWGSFAEYVAIHNADLNLVTLPENIDFATAASLGCRFATSFRAVIDQGKVRAGEWVAVHGCGGVGLSAIMIASAIGANVIAVDIDKSKLALASELGARLALNGLNNTKLIDEIIEHSSGGAHVSIDALGHKSTCWNSIKCLRKRGKHIQVGLMLGDQSQPEIPMDRVIADELEIIGSHGMQAHRYDAMIDMISSGILKPSKLIGTKVNLQDSIAHLVNMNKFQSVGATVITEFS